MISGLSTGSNGRNDASLAELQHSGIFIEWYEAVAIVQSLACTVLQSRSDGTIAMDPKSVRITSEGDVNADVIGAPSPLVAIQCLGKILADLLPSTDPMSLKVRVVAKTTSQPPGYDTLDALAQALAYYERPNRAEQIRAVYDRWKSCPAPAIRTESEIRPEASPVPAPKARQRRSRFAGVTTAAIVLAGIAGICAWTLASRLNRAEQGDSATTVSNPIDPPGDVVLAEAPSLPRSTAPKATASQAFSTTGTTSDRRTDPRQRESQSVSLPDDSLHRRSQLDPEPPPGGVASSAETVTDLPETSGVGATNETASAADSEEPVTYGPGDADVVQPTAIYPKFPNAPHRARSHERVVAFEIVINAAGTVDSVKARDLPHSLGESIVVTNALSAAKSWRFSPALKQGGPVKYRQSVALVMQ